MKISEVVDYINNKLKDDDPNLTPQSFISSTKINGYIKMGFVRHQISKHPKKAFNDYTKEHAEYIYKAYKLIIFRKIRTRYAFEMVYQNEEQKELF